MLSFLFRRRDAKLFPSDVYGDKLHAFAKRFTPLPDKALMTLSARFETRADAEAMAASQTNQGHGVFLDHDEEADVDGVGNWCLDIDVTIAPTHHELKRAVERAEYDAKSYRGVTTGWSISQWEE